MNNRTIAGGVLAAVLVLAVWWMFVFSPVRSDTSKVNDEIDTAQAETLGLETELKQLEDLEARAPEIQDDLERLNAAVPASPELDSFIDQANQLGVDTGVTWVSISPSAPLATGSAETVQMSIQVEGGYFEVLDYLNRLENLSRLVVLDQVALTAGEATAAGGGQTLTATLTGRMFSRVSAVPTLDSATTTGVAGGGGVAATPTGAQEN